MLALKAFRRLALHLRLQPDVAAGQVDLRFYCVTSYELRAYDCMRTRLGHRAVTSGYPSFEPTKYAHLVGPEQIAPARGEMICQSSRNIGVRVEIWDIG